MEVSRLNCILQSLKEGRLDLINLDNVVFINNTAMDILKSEDHSIEQITKMGLIIGISNILYNNTDRTMLPLEDGVYDILLELYKKYNPRYQVGAEPINFEQTNQIHSIDKSLKPLIRKIKPEKIDDMLYHEDLVRNEKLCIDDRLLPLIHDNYKSTRRARDTEHKYPNLVGTLDKCKFVLNSQAAERGVLNDSNVRVFERDFIQRDLKSGLLDPNRVFTVVAELKVDGVSVAAEVSDTIISATGRGDTNENIAMDLTPVFGGYKFKRASCVSNSDIFGMKFEAVITYDNIYRLAVNKGKQYKNPRNAIIGILGSLDAYTLRNYITLIPLATSMDIDRLTELEFMNKYYNSGEFLRYSVLTGTYHEILFQVKRFVEEAEYMRPFMPFMYDGVVISYIEPDLIAALGRTNSVNNYSVAIKFNALKKLTTFLGYTYSVGQNGVITPKAHFNPVEFYGTIHSKASVHSFKRFSELELKIGDIISAEFVNDVMIYLTKPDIDENRLNQNPIEEFIEFCPSCGNELKGSDSGKSVICDNIECPERNISRMVNMLQKLNLKDFSEETLKNLAKFSLTELLSLTVDDIKSIGETNSQKFIDRMNQIKQTPIYDYKLIGALGFTDVATEKWKLILNTIKLSDILKLSDDDLRNTLVSIKGIGPVTANTISNERDFFYQDLITISGMNNIISSKGIKTGKSIRFSGIRDKDGQLCSMLNDMGHDANGDAGVTKSTDILIVPHDGYSSTKTAKAGPNTIIVSYDEFVNNMDKYL